MKESISPLFKRDKENLAPKLGATTPLNYTRDDRRVISVHAPGAVKIIIPAVPGISISRAWNRPTELLERAW